MDSSGSHASIPWWCVRTVSAVCRSISRSRAEPRTPTPRTQTRTRTQTQTRIRIRTHDEKATKKLPTAFGFVNSSRQPERGDRKSVALIHFRAPKSFPCFSTVLPSLYPPYRTNYLAALHRCTAAISLSSPDGPVLQPGRAHTEIRINARLTVRFTLGYG